MANGDGTWTTEPFCAPSGVTFVGVPAPLCCPAVGGHRCWLRGWVTRAGRLAGCGQRARPRPRRSWSVLVACHRSSACRAVRRGSRGRSRGGCHGCGRRARPVGFRGRRVGRSSLRCPLRAPLALNGVPGRCGSDPVGCDGARSGSCRPRYRCRRRPRVECSFEACTYDGAGGTDGDGAAGVARLLRTGEPFGGVAEACGVVSPARVEIVGEMASGHAGRGVLSGGGGCGTR
jgi:hypothetical protein